MKNVTKSVIVLVLASLFFANNSFAEDKSTNTQSGFKDGAIFPDNTELFGSSFVSDSQVIREVITVRTVYLPVLIDNSTGKSEYRIPTHVVLDHRDGPSLVFINKQSGYKYYSLACYFDQEHNILYITNTNDGKTVPEEIHMDFKESFPAGGFVKTVLMDDTIKFVIQ